jgi:hypothetical protein
MSAMTLLPVPRSFLSLLALVAASLPAQNTPPKPAPTDAAPTAAEQQFRDAWWAESGRNDLETALRGYLAAAASDGPAAVRARANLFAGRVQQRLGRAELAMASFRRVVDDFASETDSVTAARGHLRELTAVDLRQNYDEWYERRLFSEEVQLAILAKLDELIGLDPKAQNASDRAQALRNELLAYGKGSVPALRKAAESQHERRAAIAVNMLFNLGETPPLAVLARVDHYWTNDPDTWRHLLQKPGNEPAPAGTGWHVPLLAAARRGPAALADAVFAQPTLRTDQVSPIVHALLHHVDARQRLLAALLDPTVPLGTRDGIADALLYIQGPAPLTGAEWLRVGKDPLRGTLQLTAASHAATSLLPQDGAVLDQLLQHLADENAFGSAEARIEAGTHVAMRLSENPVAELLPWSAERLQSVFELDFGSSGSIAVSGLTLRLRRNDTTRPLVAKALLLDPPRLRKCIADDDGSTVSRLRDNFGEYEQGGDSGRLAFRRQWHAALATAAAEAWPQLTDEQRTHALVLLEGATTITAGSSPLRTFLEQRGADTNTSADLKAAIQALLERNSG